MKEITKQWKPIVKSQRGTKGLGVASVNPLASPGSELARRANSTRPSTKKHI